MTINEKIRKARQAHLLTQQEVADLACLDIATVNRIEHNKAHCPRSIKKVCDVLGIEYDK